VPGELSRPPEPLPLAQQEGPKVPEDENLGVGRFRRRIGYSIASLSIALVVVTGGISLHGLWLIHPESGEHTAFDLVRIAVKGAVTIAMVTFYGFLLKMAERFCLPQHLATDAQRMAALLGLSVPSSSAAETTKAGLEAVKAGAETAKATVEAASKTLAVASGRPDR